jgi:hypothetical protein
MTIDEMEISARYLYLRRLKRHYRTAGRQLKGEMLDAAERMTELNRKYLITLLNGPGPHKKSSSSRKSDTVRCQISKKALVAQSETHRNRPGCPWFQSFLRVGCGGLALWAES